MNLTEMKKFGLTDCMAAQAVRFDGLFPGRVFSQSKGKYRVMCEAGEITAEVSGKLRFEAEHPSAFPTVGDFVMLDRNTDTTGTAIIHHVLPRKSAFIRKAAGTSEKEQIVASNIDTVFICMSLNHDFNLRRLERYLSVAWDSGAVPVVILTKSDLCGEVTQRLADVKAIAVGVEVLVTSALLLDGHASIISYIKAGQTVAFIGSSGVGKSSLINCLTGEPAMETNGLRNDDKGRHTTTRRQLILLEGGGMVIDTPGMRELGLESVDLAKSFSDIDALAGMCRFRDCTHTREPGCAVQKAILEGALSEERFANYQKLKKEADYAGLDFKQIEAKKLNEMFGSVGGMKKARNFAKEKNKRKQRF